MSLARSPLNKPLRYSLETLRATMFYAAENWRKELGPRGGTIWVNQSTGEVTYKEPRIVDDLRRRELGDQTEE